MMTSPFFTRPTKTAMVMLKVLMALLPAIVAYVMTFGIGVLVQIALATVTALLAEAIMLKVRGLPVSPFLGDFSAVLTAWLLALSIPPLAPWWLVVVGTLFAIIIAKHLYGGLGNNLFNPAMVGFAVLIVSFVPQMSMWPAPDALAALPGVAEQLGIIFHGIPAASWDAIASATPLNMLDTQLRMQASVDSILQQPVMGHVGGVQAEWIVFGYLLGGLYLWTQGLIPWQIPVGFLGGLGLTAAAFWLGGVEGSVPPLFHIATGGAMLGAFFILTDPVTGPSTPRGRLIFAALAGLLTFLIRQYGAYPDGVAFAVLIMNIAVPFIDRYTQPAVFGRKKGGAS